MILGPVLTHRAGGDDKAGNAYYVGSVLGLPNATEQDYPQVWAYAEMRHSARVASVRYLPIVWKSRLGMSERYRLLVLCYAEVEERTRIISARQAMRSERNDYEER